MSPVQGFPGTGHGSRSQHGAQGTCGERTTAIVLAYKASSGCAYPDATTIDGTSNALAA
jgi:hypothetical protein